MSVESIATKESFMSSVTNDKSDAVIVVVFTDASEESAKLLEMVEKAAPKAAGSAKFYKIEMSIVSAAAEKLGVTTAPVTVLWKGGVKGKMMTGTYGGPELKNAIEELKAQ